jgi:hypothetical protein
MTGVSTSFRQWRPLSDPIAKAVIPRKVGDRGWNRLHRQWVGDTFEDVTVKTGLQGVGYGMGVEVGYMTMTATRTFTSLPMVEIARTTTMVTEPLSTSRRSPELSAGAPPMNRP